MSIMVSPETLRRYPLFASLDHCMIKAVAMVGEVIEVKQGTWLFYEGSRADALYMVLHGAVVLKIALDWEKSCHADLCTLVEGDILGWSALVEPYIYQMGAVAGQDSTLVKWDGVGLCELMTHSPAAGYILMCRITQIIGSRLTEFCTRFASLVEGDRWQGVASPESPRLSNRN
jgi:CRP-like cAMP-binding protein